MTTPKREPSAVLLPVGGLIGQEVNLDVFLRQVVDRVAASMQADRGTLYLIDHSRGELFSRAAHLPELKQIRLKLGQGIAGAVALSGEVVNIPAAHDEQRFNPDVDKLTGYRTRSLLAVPLRDAPGEVFGVLQVLNRRGSGRFDADDETRLLGISAEVSQALQATSLYAELRRARARPEQPVGYFFNKVIGESAPMRAIYKTVQKAAQTDATVLLRGESGTGKELFARALHVNSRRADRPFVKVDCAALPGSLIENELFGHERGAFTGAEHRHPGRFEAADEGTVFIDELGELPLSVQGKLLRVLQDREFDRLGGTRTVQVDVRIVAATHRDLAQMVREGRFRDDLYFRVSVVTVELPPLRNYKDNLEILAQVFLQQAARRHERRVDTISREAMAVLQAYDFPGNMRELKNALEHAVILATGAEVRPDDLPKSMRPASFGARAPAPPSTPADGVAPLEEMRARWLAPLERQYLQDLLRRTNGHVTAAAKLAGVNRVTFYRLMERHGLRLARMPV